MSLRRSKAIFGPAVLASSVPAPFLKGSEVIVATENDTVYALDASTGAVRWSRHLASPVPSGLPCGNIDSSGITGTPVADVAAGRHWFDTFTSQPS